MKLHNLIPPKKVLFGLTIPGRYTILDTGSGITGQGIGMMNIEFINGIGTGSNVTLFHDTVLIDIVPLGFIGEKVVGALEYTIVLLVFGLDILFNECKSMSDTVLGLRSKESIVHDILECECIFFENGRVSVNVHDNVVVGCVSCCDVGGECVLSSADEFFKGNVGCEDGYDFDFDSSHFEHVLEGKVGVFVIILQRVFFELVLWSEHLFERNVVVGVQEGVVFVYGMGVLWK